MPWVFSTGRSLLSAVGTHELEEKSSGVFVGATRLRERHCVVAPALERLRVQLVRLHAGAGR